MLLKSRRTAAAYWSPGVPVGVGVGAGVAADLWGESVSAQATAPETPPVITRPATISWTLRLRQPRAGGRFLADIGPV
jgi:hypothetical protein